jgi:hypothetical protein
MHRRSAQPTVWARLAGPVPPLQLHGSLCVEEAEGLLGLGGCARPASEGSRCAAAHAPCEGGAGLAQVKHCASCAGGVVHLAQAPPACLSIRAGCIHRPPALLACYGSWPGQAQGGAPRACADKAVPAARAGPGLGGAQGVEAGLRGGRAVRPARRRCCRRLPHNLGPGRLQLCPAGGGGPLEGQLAGRAAHTWRWRLERPRLPAAVAGGAGARCRACRRALVRGCCVSTAAAHRRHRTGSARLGSARQRARHSSRRQHGARATRLPRHAPSLGCIAASSCLGPA